MRKHNEQLGYFVTETDTGRVLAISRDAMLATAEDLRTYPEYFANRTLDRFALNIYSFGSAREKAEKAFRIVKRYIDGFDQIVSSFGGGGLYFYSHERGSGKTYLSTILGTELTRRGHHVRWYSVTNLLHELKDSYDPESGTSSAAIVGTCKDAEVLILDDIGVEKQSAWVNETMYTILDHRMTHCRPTIFTSNCRPHELAYDERVVDRMNRMTELIEMPEENVRRKLNAKSKLAEYLGGEHETS